MRQPILISEVDNTSRPILLFLTEKESPAIAESAEEDFSYTWNSLKQILLKSYLVVTQSPPLSDDTSQKDILKLIRKWLIAHRNNKGLKKCGYCRYCKTT